MRTSVMVFSTHVLHGTHQLTRIGALLVFPPQGCSLSTGYRKASWVGKEGERSHYSAPEQHVQILEIGETIDIRDGSCKLVFAQVPVIILKFQDHNPLMVVDISRYVQASHIRQSAHDFWDGSRQLIVIQVPMNEGTL